MCRFLIFIGEREVFISEIVTKPKHSIVHQSYEHFLPGLEQNQNAQTNLTRANIHLNGDGFGVAWYTKGLQNPCIFTQVTPVWNNLNLNRLSACIKSSLIFTHVRAASPGSVISENNCHPFNFGKLLWMHNGGVAYFSQIKRRIHALLSDDIFAMVHGTTDSETCGALFVSFLPNQDPTQDLTLGDLKYAMLKTVSTILSIVNDYTKEHELERTPCSLNFAVSNGKHVVATRFRNHVIEEPPSLYYSTCSIYELKKQESRRKRGAAKFGKGLADFRKKSSNYFATIDSSPNSTTSPIPQSMSSPDFDTQMELQKQQEYDEFQSIIVSSEPVTFTEANWNLIDKNSIVCICGNQFQVHKDAILWDAKSDTVQVPAKDEVYAALKSCGLSKLSIPSMLCSESTSSLMWDCDDLNSKTTSTKSTNATNTPHDDGAEVAFSTCSTVSTPTASEKSVIRTHSKDSKDILTVEIPKTSLEKNTLGSITIQLSARNIILLLMSLFAYAIILEVIVKHLVK